MKKCTHTVLKTHTHTNTHTAPFTLTNSNIHTNTHIHHPRKMIIVKLFIIFVYVGQGYWNDIQNVFKERPDPKTL